MMFGVPTCEALLKLLRDEVQDACHMDIFGVGWLAQVFF